MKSFFVITLLAASALAETHGGQAPADSAPTPAMEPGLYAIITTSMGSITARLFEKEAPQTVSNFVALASGTQPWRDPATGAMADRPLYKNLTFDRVIPDYVIQTGDPTNTGRYDCGVRVKDEILPDLQFDRPGRLGIMNFGQPDTGGCQFFITGDAYPELDPSPRNYGYAIFGQVVDGQEIVNRISNVPHDVKGKPRAPVWLVSVKIQRAGPGPAEPAPKKSDAPRKLPKLD